MYGELSPSSDQSVLQGEVVGVGAEVCAVAAYVVAVAARDAVEFHPGRVEQLVEND